MPEPLRDRLDPRPVLSRVRSFEGRVWDVVTEEVDLGEGGVVHRDFVDHTGAVAILALDDQDRVVLVQQYRHPVGTFEWELPAGLLDVDGEPAHLTAARELLEEAGMPVRRVPLDEVVEAARAGDVHNGTLMIAVLAATRLRDRGWAGLRSVD